MTEMRDAIIFVGFWRPQCPPSPDAKILNYLMTERGGAIIFGRILVPPPPPQTPQYLTIYLTDREGAPQTLPFVGFWRPPLPDATVLNDLYDRERGGAPISCKKLNI